MKHLVSCLDSFRFFSFVVVVAVMSPPADQADWIAVLLGS